jgi:hypothetical protein
MSNEAPLPGNAAWEHPRVEAASIELLEAAESCATEKKKFPQDSSFDAWCRCCNRLQNAAIAFGNTVREYTL